MPNHVPKTVRQQIIVVVVNSFLLQGIVNLNPAPQ